MTLILDDCKCVSLFEDLTKNKYGQGKDNVYDSNISNQL